MSGKFPHEDGLRSSIMRGLQYVLQHQQPDGFWRDFTSFGGGSAEWITGYVGRMASSTSRALNLDESDMPQAAERARDWLIRTERLDHDGHTMNALR